MKSLNDFKDVSSFKKLLKKKKFRHSLSDLWVECCSLYPKSKVFALKADEEFLRKEFDGQNVAERSRYPQLQFGGHSVNFTVDYIQRVDKIVYALSHVNSKKIINPLGIVKPKCDLFFRMFSFGKIQPEIWNYEFLRKCFYQENNFFVPRRSIGRIRSSA